MAGSEKLYLEPVLKELLDGLNASMQSIDGIVDGLGEAVAEMKSAVDDVKEALITVQGSLDETNNNLEIVNSSIGETKTMIVTPDSYTGTAGYIGSFTAALASDRYEQGETINRFSCMCDGSLTLTGIIRGTSGVNPNNPGLLLVDETTGISLELIEHVYNSGSTDVTTLPFGVVAGHTYRLQAESNGGSGEDLFIVDGCAIKGKIFYLSADESSNNVFVMEG